MINPNAQAGRIQARQVLFNWIQPPNVDGINQVFMSLPKRINFQVNALPNQQTRTAAVIFIESETETRIAVGGAHSGWKRIDSTVVIQLFTHSTARSAEEAMADLDYTIDQLKKRLRSDHNFGDTTGTLVWQGAEPAIDVTYGEPLSQNGTSVEIWSSMRFLITQMIQA